MQKKNKFPGAELSADLKKMSLTPHGRVATLTRIGGVPRTSSIKT